MVTVTTIASPLPLRYLSTFYMRLPQPLIVHFRTFNNLFYKNNLCFCGIRGWIVRVEGEQADHI